MKPYSQTHVGVVANVQPYLPWWANTPSKKGTMPISPKIRLAAAAYVTLGMYTLMHAPVSAQSGVTWSQPYSTMVRKYACQKKFPMWISPKMWSAVAAYVNLSMYVCTYIWASFWKQWRKLLRATSVLTIAKIYGKCAHLHWVSRLVAQGFFDPNAFWDSYQEFEKKSPFRSQDWILGMQKAKHLYRNNHKGLKNWLCELH